MPTHCRKCRARVRPEYAPRSGGLCMACNVPRELHGEAREQVIAEFIAESGDDWPSARRWQELEQQAHEWR